jgi:hypothetical protein
MTGKKIERVEVMKRVQPKNFLVFADLHTPKKLNLNL